MALQLDQALLQAALVGYQKQLEELEAKMAELKRRLGQTSGPRKQASAPAAAKHSAPRQHRMSEEGRARIAAAQRARWAKAKKAAKNND